MLFCNKLLFEKCETNSFEGVSFDTSYVDDSQLFFEFLAFTSTCFFLIWTGHFYCMVVTIAKVYLSLQKKSLKRYGTEDE